MCFSPYNAPHKGRYILKAAGYLLAGLCLVSFASCSSKNDDKGDDGAVGVTYASLHEAAIDGDIQALKSFLDSGADVNESKVVTHPYSSNEYAEECKAETALVLAVENRHAEAARLLLERGADPNAKGSRGWTPLQIAAMNGDAEIATILLEHGAAVDDALDLASEWKHAAVAKILLDHGASPKPGYIEPLCLAVIKGDIEEVRKEVQGKSRYGELEPALLWAAASGNVEIAKILIGAGCNVSFEDNDYNSHTRGKTPLHLAVRDGHLEMAKLFLDRGARVDERDEGGETPLHVASTRETAELLISRGADIHARDTGGATPLHGAAATGHVGVIEVLLQHGADVNAKEEIQGGYTPLHFAAAFGHTEAAEKLLEHGADANAKAIGDCSPVVSAEYHNHKAAAALIRRHGGKASYNGF